MLHDTVNLLRRQLHDALGGDDPLELAQIAGLLHRVAPEEPELHDARAALAAAPPALAAAADEALARILAAEDGDEEEQTWAALCALDEVLAAASWLGEVEPLRALTEDAARLIRAFPEPWRPHAATASAVLQDQPPPQGDPAWTLWSAVEASRWELPLDDAGMPSRTRFELGLWVSLSEWGSENSMKLAAAGPLRDAPPWLTLARGEGWELALTLDDDDNAVVLCDAPAATVSVDGVALEPILTPVGARFPARTGLWTIRYEGGTLTLGVDP